MKLWIDDVRQPPDGSWTWVKDSASALSVLFLAPVEEISFDHDLGGDDTSMWVAKTIEELAFSGFEPPTWRIHSANPVGRRNLEACLRSADRMFARRGGGAQMMSYYTPAPENDGCGIVVGNVAGMHAHIKALQSALREILARTEDDLSPELRLSLIKNAAEKALWQK